MKEYRHRAATQIVQARLVAIAVLLRKFPINEEKALMQRWENVAFRLFALARHDARTKVGDYVRLAWRITNDSLSSAAILDQLTLLGKDFPMKTVVSELRNTDCYQGWTEQLRYLFFRYEEYLAKHAGQPLNESQFKHAVWLMRISYLRYVLNTASDPRRCLSGETLLEPFLPRSTAA